MKAIVVNQRSRTFGPLVLTRQDGTVQGHRARVWTATLMLSWAAWLQGIQSARRSVQVQYVRFVS